MAAGCALLLMCSAAARAKTQTATTAQPAQSSKTGTKVQTGTKTKTRTGAKPKTASSSTAKTTGARTPVKSHSGAVTHSTSAKRKRGTSRVATSRRKTAHGQQKMDFERVQAIQEALIREHYLTGEATGTWNQTSEDAMRRYQSDHGWQSKTVPDSRALIKLGLGPSHDHLLNPESAMTTQPDAPRATSLNPASHSADPGVPVTKTPTVDSAPPTTTGPGDSSSPQ